MRRRAAAETPKSRIAPIFVCLLLICVAAGAQTASGPVCYSCFWDHQPVHLKEELVGVYRSYPCDDYLCRGELSYLLANILRDPRLAADSVAFYGFSLQMEKDPTRRQMLNELVGFTASHGGIDSAPYLKEAARLADELGIGWRGNILRSIAEDDPAPSFDSTTIRRQLTVPPGTTHYVLGESRIVVPRGARVSVQLERTYRDWLSYQMRYDFTDSFPAIDNTLDYHEGARLRDLMRLAAVRPQPITATLAARRDGNWYAPDEKGVFRFQVANDKIEYPTVKQIGDIALLTDTHGISSLVEQSIRGESDLVIGCGDSVGKSEAAFYLAQQGIDVYFPCDRFIGLVLGYEGPGVLLGTAPIRKLGDEVVIGAQPVRFAVDEPIVVTGITHDSVARYYDASQRYFEELARHLPLNLHPVLVESEGEAWKVIEQAEKMDSKAIGVRVATEEDYEPVRGWLEKSPENRAVLFHSAPYPFGYRLFEEFPQQVTFGDPRPRFLTEKPSIPAND
jgi:hypothetical protein